ncbi:RNA polymerase sigma factor [Caulobacter sp. KR2-114]|uniref:RNA polymerase sigma factor n=1 Tax=Caulobacter sp. KR2-114 TaxID=3400912 RepID=UPI003C0F36F6
MDDEQSIPSSNAVLAERSEAVRGALQRYFARQGCEAHEIDDLVQEVFLRIVRRGGADELQRLDGYIFQTASSVFQDRYRRRKARLSDRHVPFEPETHGGVAGGPDEDLLGREALGKVSAVLLTLPERTRQVFILRRLEELSYREIAQRLGVSVSAVEKHLAHAMAVLMTEIGGRE